MSSVPVFVAKLADSLEIVGVTGADATFPLHHFEDDSGGFGGNGRLQFLKFAKGHVAKTRYQRQEWVAVMFFVRGRKRAIGPAMKTAHSGDDVGSTCAEPGKFNSAFNCLGARITEENAV